MFMKIWSVSRARCMAGIALFALLLAGCGEIKNAGGGGGGAGGGGGSNPVPGIIALNPKSAPAGGPDFFLTIYGTGFVASSVVEWNGVKLATTFVNDTLIFAQVDAVNRSASAMVQVAVFNPSPGGGLSNTMPVLVGPVPSPPAGVGVLQLISAAPDGSPGNGATYTEPAVSADGRYVAFQSDSNNLVPGPASGYTEIYIRDTCIGAAPGCTPTSKRVSVANDGTLPNGNSRAPAISANGRYVAFDSSANNLFPGSTQTHGFPDVFIRDTCVRAPTGCIPTTTLISVSNDGTQANDDARNPAISADGRFVVFNSVATNLVPNDTNGWLDIFLRDTCTGAPASCTPSTTRISVANDGSQSNVPSCCPSISADGRYVSFRIQGANNLIPNDPNAAVILHDTCVGASSGCTPSNRNLFVSYSGGPFNWAVNNRWILSASARFSGFGAGGQGSDLVPGVPGEPVGTFGYDDCIGAPAGCIPHTEQISQTYNGGQPDSGSGDAASSDDGNYVVFISIAENLLPYAYYSSAVYVRMTCKNAAPDCVPTTYLLSLDSDTGIQGNTWYSDYPAITPDGQYAVFISNASNWPGKLQSNGNNQVWLARVH